MGNNVNRSQILEQNGNIWQLSVKFNHIKGDFSLASNNKDGKMKIINCKGFPIKVDGKIMVGYNDIESLEGFTKEIGGDVILNDNKLTSLKGLPKTINGNLRLDNNKLTTLKGLSDVKGKIAISGNPITNLKYFPSDYSGTLHLSNTKIINLKGIPNGIDNIIIHDCKSLETITHIIGNNVKISNYIAKNKKTKIIEYELEAYEYKITKNEFFIKLLNVLRDNNVDLKSYNYWPKGFLNKNLIKSVDSINKFNL